MGLGFGSLFWMLMVVVVVTVAADGLGFGFGLGVLSLGSCVIYASMQPSSYFQPVAELGFDFRGGKIYN